MSHQIFYFFLFHTSLLYISRHRFSQIFRTSLNIICKKDFRHEIFLVFNGSTETLPPPHSLNSQNQLSVTKVFCRYSLNIVMEPGKSKKKLLKGHFLCIKLIEIVPCISPGLFRSFLFSQLYLFQNRITSSSGAKLFMHYILQ